MYHLRHKWEQRQRRNWAFFELHPRYRSHPWIGPLHKFFLNQPDFQGFQYMHQ